MRVREPEVLSYNRPWDVIVVGGGPAGLAAAVSAHDKGAAVCIIEREERAGGILKQCIHDGFGTIRFKKGLTGPEYACRYLEMVQARQIPLYCNTFLAGIGLERGNYVITLMNSRDSVFRFQARAIVLATGCRERTAKQVFIHGTRPAGIMTAGLAQYFVNIVGYMPVKRCLILGSGDIGLIMARRLTLEGAEVEGVYEIKSEPSGLTRNIVQCLEDYEIPLHLSSTVTRVKGKKRVEGVTVCAVDRDCKPIEGTEREVECDSLILSVGLIPEIDSVEPLHIGVGAKTGGPRVDQDFMTSLDGLFACGNALHVSDLVDHVSESGDIAGAGAASYAGGSDRVRKLVPLRPEGDLLYAVPQWININGASRAVIYFRSDKTLHKAQLKVYSEGREYLVRKYEAVRPPEMQRAVLEPAQIPLDVEEIRIRLRGQN